MIIIQEQPWKMMLFKWNVLRSRAKNVIISIFRPSNNEKLKINSK